MLTAKCLMFLLKVFIFGHCFHILSVAINNHRYLLPLSACQNKFTPLQRMYEPLAKNRRCRSCTNGLVIDGGKAKHI